MPRPALLRRCLFPVLAGLLLAPSVFAVPGDEPARPLQGRGLDNLVAFSRLLGYVRYFHPSDAAAGADWNALAIHGVRQVEPAASPEELARRLQDVFAPVAPTVRVFPTGKAPATPAGLLPPEGRPEPAVLAWRHLGVGINKDDRVYSSRRIDNRTPLLDAEANLIQQIDHAPLLGRTVRYRAWVRAEGAGQHAGAGLWLTGFGKDGYDTVSLEMKDRLIHGTEWQQAEVSGKVDPATASLHAGILVTGSGRIWIDGVSLEAERPDGTWEPVPLVNGGLDTEEPDAKGRPAGWMWLEGRAVVTPEAGGYRMSMADGCREARCVSVASVGEGALPVLPKPAEVFEADLGGGVSCRVPLSLYLDEKRATIPAAAGWSPSWPEGWGSTGNDRAVRLANVALAWNVFQHFYPYFDVVRTDWPAALREALTSAATDKDEMVFADTLRLLMARLHDGHGGAAINKKHMSYASLPLVLRSIEDQVAVVAVVPEKAGRVKPGDVVLEFDGVPAAEVVQREERLISGATPQWKRWQAVNRLGRGPVGQIRLKLQPAEGEPYEITLARDVPRPFPTETRPEKIAEVRPGIYYVDLQRIDDADFAAAVETLARAKGVIFDLRGYPAKVSTAPLSHLIDAPITSARWNVPIVTRPDRQGMDFQFSNWPVQPVAPRFQGKVVFLIDGRAISYAETYMGMVEHYRLAEIVGSPTAGTNGNVNPLELPGGYSLAWTGMKVLKHDGSQHHGIGILPTVPALPTLKGLREGRDDVLEKGIEVVSR